MFIDKQPQIFTPAYNPVLFMISSTFSNVLYFNLQLNDIETGTRIINDKAYVTPVTPTSTHYNPSDIAKDLVTWQIVNDGTIARAITKSTRLIQLQGSDNGVVGNTMSQLGQTASSNQFTVWNGQFPRHEFTDYNYQEWVTGGTGSISFLTEKPNYSLVNDTTRDFLYFLKVPSFTATTILFTKFDSAGNTLGSFTASFGGTSSMVRLDVSPKAIKLVQPTFFTNVNNYSVQLYNVSLPISEKKYFRYDNTDCNKDVVNILWQNSLGGIDSYQFVNPVETKNVERFQIRKNPYQYNDTYQYTDIDQSTYNDKERVVHNNPTSQWTMYTRELTNNESRWLGKIVNAKRWWVEMTSGRTYPVSLIESSYLVQNTKYIRDNVVTAQLTFNIVDDNIQYDEIYAGTASIALVATTTTTTTSTSTSTTTSGSSTTTTTSTTTSTTTTINSFGNSGYGDSTATACSDKEANNRTLYSNCSTIAASCIIYTDSGGTLPLLGYTHIFIDGLNWLIDSSTGAITGVDPVQC